LTGYGVRLTVSMTAEQFRRFIAGLRENARYLRVERLSVTAPQIQPSAQNALFTATLEVYGYAQTASPTRGDRQ
jgi:hypothetical protein